MFTEEKSAGEPPRKRKPRWGKWFHFRENEPFIYYEYGLEEIAGFNTVVLPQPK